MGEAERGVPSPPELCPSQKFFSILCLNWLILVKMSAFRSVHLKLVYVSY